jgi:hypothetical protein
MRIKAIQLSWFRGAADQISLESNCKSMVVYGENGSGKSCFVDAVEYVLNNGKIGHLAHEYSGKHQEKAIHNTHKPKGQKTELGMKFGDNSELKIVINSDGSFTSLGAEEIAMSTWNYGRTVLRQDEVAAFIHDTKGGKYSALLPLLGLHKMEIAAENLRQLAKSVEQQSKLNESKGILSYIKIKRKEIFGADSDGQILSKIGILHLNYCVDHVAKQDALSRCNDLEIVINKRIEQFSADQKRYLALHSAGELDLKSHVRDIRTTNAKLAEAVEPFISEKLEVLAATGEFVTKLGDKEDVKCPACGQMIPVETFRAHVKTEQERLQEIIDTFNTRKTSIGTLCDNLKTLQSNLGKVDVKSWKDELSKGPLVDNFVYLEHINIEALRTSCGEEDLREIEKKLMPLIDTAADDSKDAPKDVQQLSTDSKIVTVGKSVITANDMATSVTRAEKLISFINSLERGVREEIRLRSEAVISEISTDIRDMWAILHPNEPIEAVRLYLPKNIDKAIDIELKFFGVTQNSPRLTLSEGHRNSLGLCIFLAMANRKPDNDRPLILDDVVVSFDRNHRGMIVDVLEKSFGKRQVLLLTHDREWYCELRQLLDGKNWAFKTLLPYEAPKVGIRWSHKTTTFDDARAQLKERPDSAGNTARKIMDIELGLIAERLRIRLPFMRAERNDRRMAHDFLERFVADGKKCFQKKVGSEYVAYSNALDAFDKAERLLISWANRASHTFDIVRPEAAKLIEACEEALGFFSCSSCVKGVWVADIKGSEWVQCQCSEIRWRYGKG